jgi:hypothetical protein
MFGLGMLDVAIGLSLVFFVFSLALTAANEALDAWLKLRASNLERGLRELLDDEDGTRFAKAFFDHPLIYPLYRGAYDPASRTLPSYIPARNFSLALLDLVAGPAAPGDTNAPSDKVRRVVNLAIKTGGGDPDRARAELEAWYDSAMDRVSGWYKRRTQVVTFCLALGVAVLCNVNTIAIFQALQVDANLRSTLVEQAKGAGKLDVDTATKELAKTSLPIGWTGRGWTDMTDRLGGNPGAIERIAVGFQIAVGWLLTAFAVMLGSPFWFDILNRLMVIRSTVKPHEKSGEEASEERKDSPKKTPPAAPAGAPGAALTTTGFAFSPAGGALAEQDGSWEEDQDGCICDHDISEADATRDEDLPPATGGVAAPYAPPVPA